MHTEIIRAMEDQMWKFKEKDPDFVRAKQKKKAGASDQPTILGFGQRTCEHKKQIGKAIEHHNNKVSGNQPVGNKKGWPATKVPLMEVEDIPKPGTPKGNKSIRSVFAIREAGVACVGNTKDSSPDDSCNNNTQS